MNKDPTIMNSQTEIDILTAHADRLGAGLRGVAAYPPMTPEQERALAPLLELAEWLAEALVPVEPSPLFVQRLGHALAQAAIQRQLPLLERYRRMIWVTAATLGSAVPLLGLLLYYFWQRDSTEGHPAG
jgi:hypothetical protein